MPLREFSLNDVGEIRSVECSDVPKLMVVAGPNGVGKSTMFEEVTEEAVSERIDEVTSVKKERISEMIGDVRNDVSNSITDQDYSRLNGKVIITQMASKFGLQSDVLVRTTAKIIGSNDSQPDSLTGILDDITDTVDDTTPASIIETIE
ncbi:hypothetical protein [Halorubrum trapanicum]|uniref:hypothetical protein n=1 Tax=Halorubrum trapanicum TaxID=29284 RepID=UPI0012FD1E12|nr:hypothetical protein [Halorubrum trapanicum]